MKFPQIKLLSHHPLLHIYEIKIFVSLPAETARFCPPTCHLIFSLIEILFPSQNSLYRPFQKFSCQLS